MDVDILYVPDCPNLERARRRLREALDAAGLVAVVREREVLTAEAAVRVGMRGSPTILINGHDPFDPHGDGASVSCRLYGVDGAIDGSPSVSQLLAALRAEDPV